MQKRSLCVVGMLWGDEGKGKIIDFLSRKYEVIIRSQGGDNAGHTIIVDNKKYKFRLLPSGVLHENKKIILGNGIAINLETLAKEMDLIKSINVSSTLKISERAHVVMPYHIQLDELYEEIKGSFRVGTTKRGIGPCYEDKVSRIGIRVCDLLDKTHLKEKIKLALKFKNPFFKTFQKAIFNLEELVQKYHNLGKQFEQYITNTGIYLENEIKNNQKLLFEGAQGVMLCIEHGTYPYVTSSSPTAASIALSNGIDHHLINNTLGILKAYSTRVGEGPFPTEDLSPVAEYIRKKGNEYGTVTKRPRRVGWLDLVLLKHSRRVSGVNLLAITLIDVLSGISKIKICTHYLWKGRKIVDFPANLQVLNECEPQYKMFDGWKEELSNLNINSFNDLPVNCQKYLEFIEKELNCKLSIISFGPSREKTIFRDGEI